MSAASNGNANPNAFTVKWIPPILAYCTASICMTLVNKLVLSGFKYKLPFLMLGVQVRFSGTKALRLLTKKIIAVFGFRCALGSVYRHWLDKTSKSKLVRCEKMYASTCVQQRFCCSALDIHEFISFYFP